jgi:hypothetical protein
MITGVVHHSAAARRTESENREQRHNYQVISHFAYLYLLDRNGAIECISKRPV